MPFKIIRNDITKMRTDAIVNTANAHPVVGPGCDYAVYEAAGRDELLSYRKEHIGHVQEGDAFITPAFHLPAKYIIHAVSPLFVNGGRGEEALLRSCYKKSLALAEAHGIRSIAFPLISTGSFGYPKEEGMRIAVDEIHAFLLTSEMLVYLVVFDEKAAKMSRNLYPDLEAYIDENYVEEKRREEYEGAVYSEVYIGRNIVEEKCRKEYGDVVYSEPALGMRDSSPADEDTAIEEMERKLEERMAHMADTFPQYLLYLIAQKGMENAEVYKRAIVDKKVFSKIKNNPNYHPQKLTALCLCIGAKLNLDEARDLLARAGYALSPCDKTDIIFSYFIEHQIYDMIELDIQLEEHGLPCIIA